MRSFAESEKISRAIVLTRNLWDVKKNGKLTVHFLPLWMAAKIPEMLSAENPGQPAG